MAKITNKLVQELNERVGGNKHQLHSNLCKLVCQNPDSVNASSLQITVNRMLHHIDKLKHARNMDDYQNHLKADFRFPRQPMKRKLETDADSQCIRHEKIIKFQESQIVSLKARYRNANISVLNQKIKRQTETIVRLKDEIRSLKAVKKEPSNKYMSVEAGVQCNTLKSSITDLETELDNFQMQININNNGVENDDGELNDAKKKIYFQNNEKGKSYNEKLRKIYYLFLSRRIGLQHTRPVIEAVLSLVDFEIEKLPSLTTACKMVNEMVTISRMQLQEQLSSNKLTMHRDATTKKGHHYYAVEYSNDDGQTLTAGLREVCNGKAETYVKSTHEILGDISQDS